MPLIVWSHCILIKQPQQFIEAFLCCCIRLKLCYRLVDFTFEVRNVNTQTRRENLNLITFIWRVASGSCKITLSLSLRGAIAFFFFFCRSLSLFYFTLQTCLSSSSLSFFLLGKSIDPINMRLVEYNFSCIWIPPYHPRRGTLCPWHKHSWPAKGKLESLGFVMNCNHLSV